jgi:hypothetical protein
LDLPPAQIALTASGGTVLYNLTTVELARRLFTIVRTHIQMFLESDQLSADEFQAIAIGGAVVSDQAVAAGVASVPTPVTDDDSDYWWFHQYFMSSFAFASGVGFEAPGGSQMSIDSKAMRKVDDGQDVSIVAELASAISAGVILSTAGRMLIKNH